MKNEANTKKNGIIIRESLINGVSWAQLNTINECFFHGVTYFGFNDHFTLYTSLHVALVILSRVPGNP